MEKVFVVLKHAYIKRRFGRRTKMYTIIDVVFDSREKAAEYLYVRGCGSKNYLSHVEYYSRTIVKDEIYYSIECYEIN